MMAEETATRPGLRRRACEALTYRGLGLPRSFADFRFRHVAFLLVIAATIWGHVDVSRRGRIEGDKPEVHRTDFTVYVEAGAAFFTPGRDPYQVMNARGWTYLYPPILALMVAPLSYLDTVSQVSVWFAVSVVLSFGCYREAQRVWMLVVAPDGENARPALPGPPDGPLRDRGGPGARSRLHAARAARGRAPVHAAARLSIGLDRKASKGLVAGRVRPVVGRGGQVGPRSAGGGVDRPAMGVGLGEQVGLAGEGGDARTPDRRLRVRLGRALGVRGMAAKPASPGRLGRKSGPEPGPRAGVPLAYR